MSEQNLEKDTGPSALERILGDRPGAVILRLVLISLVVGFLMTMFGLNARDIAEIAVNVFRDTFRDSGELLRSGVGYVLTGAAVVIPIWLLMRLTSRRRR